MNRSFALSSILPQKTRTTNPTDVRIRTAASTAAGQNSADQSTGIRKVGTYWSNGSRRLKLALFSFLFALLPAIVHLKRKTDNTWSLYQRKRNATKRQQELDSDSSSGSDNESADDECQVQLSYQQTLASEVELMLIKLLPLKLLSRIWGWINSVPLPVPIRVRIISWYSSWFNCNLSEACKQDLKEYANLGDFFKRELKPGVRPIESGDIVSPCDGTVVHFGKVDKEHVEQVKGVKYSLAAFLGPQTWDRRRRKVSGNLEKEYHQKLVAHPGHSLYHCVIYLAPGDYHRFHSPTHWNVRFRRHFSGKLMSIKPSFMSWIEDLFTINERVAYIGKWTFGFFSMTAVGATNVGSVRVYFDSKLKTNRFLHFPGSFADQKIRSVIKSKGDPFGEFNLGSTIVLIFEAPSDFACHVSPGQKIRYGQRLFNSRRDSRG